MDSRYFTEEHNLFRQSLADFLQKEVVPHIEKWEETGHIERFIFFGVFRLNDFFNSVIVSGFKP